MDVGFATVAFVGPVVGLGIHDFTRFPTNMSSYVYAETVTIVYYSIWCLALMLMYVSFYYCVRREDWVQIVYRRSLNDVARLLYDASFLFVSGGVRNKMEKDPGLFFGTLVGYAVAYGVVFALFEKRNIKFTKDGLRQNSNVRIVIGIVTVAMILLFIDLLMTAWTISAVFFSVYATVFFGVCIVHAVMLCTDAKWFHLHHWATALMGAHACVFDSTTSIVAQAMFTAVYLHGMACFGAELVF